VFICSYTASILAQIPLSGVLQTSSSISFRFGMAYDLLRSQETDGDQTNYNNDVFNKSTTIIPQGPMTSTTTISLISPTTTVVSTDQPSILSPLLLLSLPSEIYNIMLSFCTIVEVLVLAFTCKSLYKFVTEEFKISNWKWIGWSKFFIEVAENGHKNVLIWAKMLALDSNRKGFRWTAHIKNIASAAARKGHWNIIESTLTTDIVSTMSYTNSDQNSDFLFMPAAEGGHKEVFENLCSNSTYNHLIVHSKQDEIFRILAMKGHFELIPIFHKACGRNTYTKKLLDSIYENAVLSGHNRVWVTEKLQKLYKENKKKRRTTPTKCKTLEHQIDC